MGRGSSDGPVQGRRTSREWGLRHQLRRATADVHERLERTPLLRRLQDSREDYLRFLSAMLGIVEPVEAAVRARRKRFLDALDLESRRRSDCLSRDLRDFGLSAAAVSSLPRCAVPSPDGEASALGYLYVLEGSTLGGRVLLRSAGPRLGIDALRGGRFLAGHGDATGARWARFLAVLTSAESLVSNEEVITGAIALFSTFESWFSAWPGAPILDALIHDTGTPSGTSP